MLEILVREVMWWVWIRARENGDIFIILFNDLYINGLLRINIGS